MMKSLTLMVLSASGVAAADSHVAAPARTATATPEAEPMVVREPAPGPSPGYLALGGAAGLDAVAYAGVFVDGGIRIPRTPLYVRAALERGLSSEEPFVSGNYLAYRLGIEARTCGRIVCGFSGVDLAERFAKMNDHYDDGSITNADRVDGSLIPRAGIEVGSRVKGRLALEVPIVGKDDVLVGAGVTAGLGFAF